MKLQLKGDKQLVERARRAHAEKRIALVLARYEAEVQTVTLRLSTVKVGGGGPATRCEIAVELKPDRLVVDHVDPDFATALDRAADKAARAIARAEAKDRKARA